jgi:hypothetical protein
VIEDKLSTSLKLNLINESDYLTIQKTTCLCTHNWIHTVLRHKSLKDDLSTGRGLSPYTILCIPTN